MLYGYIGKVARKVISVFVMINLFGAAHMPVWQWVGYLIESRHG